MRIAVVANTAWYLVNFRLNLMRALQEAGHEVVAVAPPDGYVARIIDANIDFEPVAIDGSGINPVVEARSVISLNRTFRRKNIDLVISFTPKGNLYSGLALQGGRQDFLPGVSGLGRAFIRRSLVTHLARLLYRLTFRRAHLVLFENRDDLSLFVEQELVRASAADIVPGAGVDLRWFDPTALIHGPQKKHVAGTGFSFLMVARVLWDKGVGEFIDAARNVRMSHPLVRFQLLGEVGVDNPAAVPRSKIELWQREGIFEYLGKCNDVRPFLADADCVVLPSYREGLPRTLLEAAAMARPVITTDAVGCRDAVIDGETGLLCRARDAEDLAAQMRRFIAMPQAARCAMGAAGRAFVEREFDERIVIGRYLEVVSGIAGDRQARRHGEPVGAPRRKREA